MRIDIPLIKPLNKGGMLLCAEKEYLDNTDDDKEVSDMLETLPSAWRMFLANIILKRNVQDLIARLNALDSECTALRGNRESSHMFVEILHRKCLACKSEIDGRRKTGSSRMRYYDPNVGLPDGFTLTHEFIDHIRTFLRGIFGRDRGRRVDIPYTVMVLELENDVPVMLNTLHAFAAILRHRLRRSLQRVGYLGENRFVIVDIGSPGRQAKDLEKSIRSAAMRTPQMKDIALLIGSSESSISFSLEERGMGDAIDRIRQTNYGKDLRNAIRQAHQSIARNRHR
jgi:hypothetical protein